MKCPSESSWEWPRSAPHFSGRASFTGMEAYFHESLHNPADAKSGALSHDAADAGRSLRHHRRVFVDLDVAPPLGRKQSQGRPTARLARSHRLHHRRLRWRDPQAERTGTGVAAATAL